jgi:crossover junction endodeoxyribonuclease RusA
MIRLPWPHPALSPNARVHWAPKNKISRMSRTLAWGTAKQAKHPTPAWDGPIAISLLFLPGKGKRREDEDNRLASCKSYLDGLADALGVNDSRFRIVRNEVGSRQAESELVISWSEA